MGASAKVGAREAQRLATRERLFAAAVAECKRTGVASADVGVIVAEAGVSHGTFFHHFPTKEHVVAELRHREEVRMTAELDRFLADPRDLQAALMEVVRLVGAVERRLGARLFKDILALHFSPDAPEPEPANHPIMRRLTEEFARAGAPEPANSVLFFLLGLYALLVTHDRTAERTELLEQYVRVLLRGLGVR